jgi:hypothetical protein
MYKIFVVLFRCIAAISLQNYVEHKTNKKNLFKDHKQQQMFLKVQQQEL